MFEEAGYVDANVSDIIRASGGSRASFYSYFTSKDDVLEELVRELTDDLFEASTRPVRSGSSPFETLTSTIRQFMEAYRDRAAMLAVLDQATVSSDVFRSVRLEVRVRFADAIAERLGRRSDVLDADGLEARTTAIALGGMVEDMARGRYLLGQELDEAQVIRTLAAIWARAIGLPTN